MMKLFKDTEHLSKNSDFELRAEEENYFFIRKSGHKVVTDKLGKTIWKNLPGTATDIKKGVKKELNISDELIAEFLYILLRADLIKSSLKEKEGILSHIEHQEQPSDLISVIIVTCNGEEHIKGCLQSILSQTYKNLEIIVVDNFSQDQTVKIIKELFPQVKVYELKKNAYYPGAVNYGIKKAKGDYLFILNDDTELKGDCIAHMHNKMKSEAKVGAVSPMMKFYHLRGLINGIGNHIREYGWGSDNFIGCVDVGQFSDLKEVPSACFGAVLLNREAVEQIGLLDKKYTAYYEDVDWSFRCWLNGWKIIPAERAVVYHKFGAFWKTMKRKLKFVVRNRLRLVLKTFKGRTRLVFLKRYILEDIKNSLSLLKKKEYSLVLANVKAYISLFLSLPDIFLKRKRIMRRKLRNMSEDDILKKNPIFYSCLNEDNIPTVNSRVIFSYYRWEFIRMNKVIHSKTAIRSEKIQNEAC